jgi:hypothetical protein
MSFKTGFTKAEMELLRCARDEFDGCQLAVTIGSEKRPHIGHVDFDVLDNGDWHLKPGAERVYVWQPEQLLFATYALELLQARKRIAELEEAVYYACDGDAYKARKRSFESAAKIHDKE